MEVANFVLGLRPLLIQALRIGHQLACAPTVLTHVHPNKNNSNSTAKLWL